MMKKVVFILLLITGLYIGTVAAIPVVPEEWHGAVFLNGNPAPAGTVIIAQVNGQPAGQITTTEQGLYGSQLGQNSLYAQISEEDLNKGNATVTFLVNGVQAFQAVPYVPGSLVKLDIYADKNTMPSSPPTISPASQSAGPGTGSVSQSSAGGFPVESASATAPAAQPATGSVTSAVTYGGPQGSTLHTPTAQKTSGSPGAVQSSAPTGNSGTTMALPSTTTMGIVLVVVVIVLAVVYMMRKQGKL